jgi:DNA-binding response OmpR family regulator
MQQMKKVVIIEDNRVIQHILKSWFKEEEFKVVSLENTDHLVDKLETFRPDLIITDIMLPDTTAADMLKIFSNLEYPVIVISSMDDDDVSYFASRIGAIASFTKPIKVKEIFDFIHNFFTHNNQTTNTLFI